MTVEAYLRSLVPGLDLQESVLQRCARSPKEIGLQPLSLTEDIDASHQSEEDFQNRLDYASSCIYYSVLGVFAGGGYSEQVGDVRVSRGGYTITMADRDRYKLLGDALRKKHGWELDADASSNSGISDYSVMRNVPLSYESY